MSKAFEERNQTDTAKRKLKSLAKASCLDVELVTALANFTWDYDPRYRNESTGWVSNDDLPAEAKHQLDWIAGRLGLSPDFRLTRQKTADELIAVHRRYDVELLWANFLTALATKNYGPVSEFASYYYLRGLTSETVSFLAWNAKDVGVLQIVRNLFLKLFRGGAMQRWDLAYLWCDLVIDLNYQAPSSNAVTPWIGGLLDSVESLPPNSGLKDLLGCCKGVVGGDKFFKQEVLQALAYADVLRVNQLPVSEMFLAERRDESSPHYYSNEWTFPLRFWGANGGTVNRSAIPAGHII